MKRFTIACIAALLFSAPFSTVTAKNPKPLRITVMTYNVQAGKRLPTEKYAEFIKKYDPDFVAVQEIDYMTKRFKKEDFLGDLAGLTGMYFAYGPSMYYSEGQYGVGLLSKTPLLSSRVFCLPQPEGSYEPRVAVSAVAEVKKGMPVRFTSTHLDLPTQEIRRAQVEALTKWLSGDEIPSILAGDFNATPDDASIKAALGSWHKMCGDDPTYPETSPKKKIDYILAKGKGTWKTVSYERVVDTPLSDHCPVIVTLEYTE